MRVRKITAVPGAVQPVSQEEAKQQARVDCADEDGLIGTYITAATEAASDRLQRALVPSRYRLTLDAFPVGAIELLLPPVTSVQSVTYIDDDGATQTMAAQDYYLDAVSEPARLLPAVGTSWPEALDRVNAVQVEYTAGYPASAIPSPIKSWILLAVGDLYEQRTRSAEKPVVPQHFADSLLDTYKIWSL
jgi:uncharacterized phiE125 gp8 family phage protein